ncbi:MAG: hypothetical protein ACYC5K_04840, partial [Saccharofermentanales bacterium]
LIPLPTMIRPVLIFQNMTGTAMERSIIYIFILQVETADGEAHGGAIPVIILMHQLFMQSIRQNFPQL